MYRNLIASLAWLVLALGLPALAEPAALRTLPEQAQLRYAVYFGDKGFKLGTTTTTWKSAQGHYSLNSVAEASGLASLILSGQAVQASEGQLTASGLKPESFLVTRKGKRKEYARFDWPRQRLELARNKLETLPAQTQDLLSLGFHLAMTASESGSWVLPVTNGKVLKDYRFRVVGHERLQLAGQSLDTLHIQASRANEGDTDLWLGTSLHWLPVRIRNVDEDGTPIVQNLLDSRF